MYFLGLLMTFRVKAKKHVHLLLQILISFFRGLIGPLDKIEGWFRRQLGVRESIFKVRSGVPGRGIKSHHQKCTCSLGQKKK